MDLWARCRGGDFAPEAPPFAGGPAEQPAYLMACFDVIRASVRALERQQ